jgi:hypothetical protein
VRYHEGKEVIRECVPTDPRMSKWILILTDAGWRGVHRTGSVTFWVDESLDALVEAWKIQQWYLPAAVESTAHGHNEQTGTN